jgi:hypothetical protein
MKAQAPYPADCPHCREAEGWPYSAGTCDRPGIIVVKLRCKKCDGEWIADAPKSVMATASYWPKRQNRTSRTA